MKDQDNTALYHTKSNILFENTNPENYYKHHPRPILVGDKLRNADNIGAIIRLADNIGAAKAMFLGDATSVKQSKIQRCAASSFHNIAWGFVEMHDIDAIMHEGYSPVCIETASHSTDIFATPLPEKPAFIVGNEVHGIGKELLDKTSVCVYIPVPGPTRSLNVSHAMGVAVFEWWRQMQQRINQIK